MQLNNKEAPILLANETIQKDRKLCHRKTAELYNLPYTTLNHRMNGIILRFESRANFHNLTELKENVIVQ